MSQAVLDQPATIDLQDQASYERWRDTKLATCARRTRDLIVDVADPAALSAQERDALLACCMHSNMAIYRSPIKAEQPGLARQLGRQLGLERLDVNWLAEDDGLSRIEVSSQRDGVEGRGGFIPYTDRPINWHTDGYYHPPERRIRAMILHCVRPARDGGVNRLIDHELIYIALRDASPRWAQALMAPDAMTIPGRADDLGVARPAQAGPVFSIDPVDGQLHMRYTARTRSIAWKDDIATAKAVAFLQHLLVDGEAHTVRLEAGMGIVANNVLHDRSAFQDDPAAPRLLYRARYLDRVGGPAWRNG